MATAITTVSLNCHDETLSSTRQIGSQTKRHTISLISINPKTNFWTKTSLISIKSQRNRFSLLNELKIDSNHSGDNNPEVQLDNKDGQVDNVGVRAALSMLRFYKREISPLLPKSCRYIPTCSEYSMQAYKKYGVVKGTVLTAWRLCRCNPLGGSGFDPPRWFGEKAPTLEEEEDDKF